MAGRARNSDDARARLLRSGLPGQTDAALLEAIARSEIVIENKLSTRDFGCGWESGEPHVAYLGDAAHPLRPTGEGTALAIEDAWVLGSLARDAADAAAFLAPASLREYERLRLPRVRAVSGAVRETARRFYEREGGAEAAEGLARGRVASVAEAMRAHPVEAGGL